MPDRPDRLNAKQVEDVLARNGFRLVSQRGSHRKWRHDAQRSQVIVPDHRGRDLPIGTLRAIQSASGIAADEWHR
ncbi:MAG TPA: type II toxin-antitoxin system HicA family toxin [Armatimonadota bacterium]